MKKQATIKKVAIIGCGVMGSIIIKRCLQSKVFQAGQLLGCDRDADKLKVVSRKLAVKTTASPSAAIQGADIIILAVKPQQFAEVASELAGKLEPSQLVISIMAGVAMASLIKKLMHRTVVRAMPNVAARVGRAVTVWHASRAVKNKYDSIVKEIFAATGKEMFVKQEVDVDKATAVSGSGPAYWFWLGETLIKAACDLGFNKQEAEFLVVNTFLGSAELFFQSDFDFTYWKNAVTSKGGTTEAVLRHLADKKAEKIWQQAVHVAFRRALELAKN